MKHLAFWAALVAAAWWIVMLVAGGATYPGYSHVSQYISELGAVGAPHADIVNWGAFFPLGIVMVVFALSAMAALPKTPGSIAGFLGIVLYAAGYSISAFYPCDAGCRPADDPSLAQLIHTLGAIVSYAGGAAGLLFLSSAAGKWPRGGGLAQISLVAGCIGIVCFLALGPHDYVGLVQRLYEAAMIVVMIATGLHVRSLSLAGADGAESA